MLDSVGRRALISGEIRRARDRGVRGLTTNPSMFEEAMRGSAAYDAQLRTLTTAGLGPTDAYWAMVIDDIHQACDVFSKVYDVTAALDGYVSVEVDPH